MKVLISNTPDLIVAQAVVEGHVEWNLNYGAGSGNLFVRNSGNNPAMQLGTYSIKIDRSDTASLLVRNPTDQDQVYTARIVFTQGGKVVGVWEPAVNKTISGTDPEGRMHHHDEMIRWRN